MLSGSDAAWVVSTKTAKLDLRVSLLGRGLWNERISATKTDPWWLSPKSLELLTRHGWLNNEPHDAHVLITRACEYYRRNFAEMGESGGNKGPTSFHS